MFNNSHLHVLTVAHLSPQWLDGAGAEGEDVAEEEDEGEVDQGDDHKAIQLLLIIPLFVQDIFFFFQLVLTGNDL